jgi:hypothetical protein
VDIAMISRRYMYAAIRSEFELITFGIQQGLFDEPDFG